MQKSKLYSILLIACLVGYGYLLYTIYNTNHRSFCIIKNITRLPCPSCGTTRAVTLLFQGKIIESLFFNPFGIIVAVIMTVFPVWVLTDIALKKDTFFKVYKKTEATIRKPWIAVILISLVVLNWIWNIYKHL